MKYVVNRSFSFSSRGSWDWTQDCYSMVLSERHSSQNIFQSIYILGFQQWLMSIRMTTPRFPCWVDRRSPGLVSPSYRLASRGTAAVAFHSAPHPQWPGSGWSSPTTRKIRYRNVQCCRSGSESGSVGSVCFRASWIRILLSSCKNNKKNLDSYCFVTLFEKWCKCTLKKYRNKQKNFLF